MTNNPTSNCHNICSFTPCCCANPQKFTCWHTILIHFQVLLLIYITSRELGGVQRQFTSEQQVWDGLGVRECGSQILGLVESVYAQNNSNNKNNPNS